jgi:CBS domain containing-hemolysin-like protein
MEHKIIMIIMAVLAVALGGLFSGAETGMYQLSRLRLRLGIERKKLRFVVLGKAMRDSNALLLTMLTGTNLANYIATSIVTMMLLSTLTNDHTAELLATLITAPTLFVFSELIPKNLFFYRADSLMPFFSPLIYAFHRLFTFCGVVPMLKAFSSLFARLAGTTATTGTLVSDLRSSYIESIFHETREEALLSSVQTDIIKRIVRFPGIRLNSVMTAMSKVQMVNINTDNRALLSILSNCLFTRLLVYRQNRNNIIGFVNIYDCLASDRQFTDLKDYTKPIRKLSTQVTVAGAMDIMQKENEKIVLVTRTTHSKERPVGIVTMKDLVEELLGELTEW